MIRWATASLLVAVAGLLTVLVWLRNVDGVYQLGEQLPLQSGFLVDASRVDLPPRACVILRVTSDSCAFCSQDRIYLDGILAVARHQGCSSVAVGPKAGDITMSSVGEALPLQYVDLATAKVLAPVVTPQTLILDASRRIVWRKQGALTEDDTGRALKALAKMR